MGCAQTVMIVFVLLEATILVFVFVMGMLGVARGVHDWTDFPREAQQVL